MRQRYHTKNFDKLRHCDKSSPTIIVPDQGAITIDNQRFGTQQEIIDFGLGKECYTIRETIVEAFTLENPNVFVLENLDTVH